MHVERCDCFVTIVYNVKNRNAFASSKTFALETCNGSVKYLIGVTADYLQHKTVKGYAAVVLQYIKVFQMSAC